MAVVAVKAPSITTLDAGRPVNVTTFGGRVRNQVETLDLTNGDSIGSVYRFFRVKSNWRPLVLSIKCDAITTCAGDIGLYQTAGNGGAVVSATTFATAQSLATAITTAENNMLYEAGDIINIQKRFWEWAGASADSQIYYDIALTLTAAAGSAGTVSMALTYVID